MVFGSPIESDNKRSTKNIANFFYIWLWEGCHWRWECTVSHNKPPFYIHPIRIKASDGEMIKLNKELVLKRKKIIEYIDHRVTGSK